MKAIQPRLFYETWQEAAMVDILACGGIKGIAGALWPTMPPGSAETKLRNCLNPEQRHELDPNELMLIIERARDNGSCALLQYVGTKGRARFELIEPQAELYGLMQSIADDQKAIAHKMDLVQRIAKGMGVRV